MFGKLKDKLKGVINSFSKKVEQEGEDIVPQNESKETKILEKEIEDLHQEEKLEKKKEKVKKDITQVEEINELEKNIDKDRIKQETKLKESIEEPKEVIEKKGFFTKISDSITKKRIDPDKFEELFYELEIILLENNVCFEVVEKIRDELKEKISGKIVSKKDITDTIKNSLKETFEELLNTPIIDIFKESSKKKPYVISFIGINGSGKTTQLAKIANLILKQKKTVVVAAADTFRSAAIQQLEEHTTKLGVKLIKHDYGADPTAVAYDAVEHAKSKNIDFVLIDTAGRLHSNENLMKELQKMIRVINPDLNIFVGESITGNDCIQQVSCFLDKIKIDGIILTKADIDEKGGTAISISHVTKKPILFMGVGQEYEDIIPFEKEMILKNLGF